MLRKSKVFNYASKWNGEPKLSDFELTMVHLEPINDGEFLAEAMFFGINAGLRAYSDLLPIGSMIFGAQVAKLVFSSL